MGCYVEPLMPWGGSTSILGSDTCTCHLLADDIDELHAMAASMGLSRDACQDGQEYLLTPFLRALALQRGAREINWHEYALRKTRRRNEMKRKEGR